MLEMTEEDLNQMIEDARRDSTSNNEAEGVKLNQENAEAKEGEQDAKPDKSVLSPEMMEGVSDGRLPSGTNVNSLPELEDKTPDYLAKMSDRYASQVPFSTSGQSA